MFPPYPSGSQIGTAQEGQTKNLDPPSGVEGEHCRVRSRGDILSFKFELFGKGEAKLEVDLGHDS
jgi:hypothetical protein